ncbi:hypothetical protein PROAA_3410002 [Candidatus Propionivibrio aalborgensis]|uniref:Uncharacterized protein n=1 Tax=Candidatus Propionivibrio aalborgensis TaxID=1860101 RepID=A0A1A8XYJ0_9RHOO|nr:hypothetical protein PROAA_3410002 [Candidatus Propionivibrio aalborgensis]
MMRAQSGGGRDNADRATAPGALDRELNVTLNESEQGVILAEADVFTWMEFGAALANDDVSGEDHLPAIAFYAQTFRLRVTSVT